LASTNRPAWSMMGNMAHGMCMGAVPWPCIERTRPKIIEPAQVFRC